MVLYFKGKRLERVGTDLGSYPVAGYFTSCVELASSITREKEREYVFHGHVLQVCL
jgi:hypothetical protein